MTEEQRVELKKIWFLYGNKGKKHTHFNHRFIQNLIEHDEDTRDFYLESPQQKNPLLMLTAECINRVDQILKSK